MCGEVWVSVWHARPRRGRGDEEWRSFGRQSQRLAEFRVLTYLKSQRTFHRHTRATHRTLQLEQLQIRLRDVVLQTGYHALRDLAVQADVRSELVLVHGVAFDGLELFVEAVYVCFEGCDIYGASVLRTDSRQLQRREHRLLECMVPYAASLCVFFGVYACIGVRDADTRFLVVVAAGVLHVAYSLFSCVYYIYPDTQILDPISNLQIHPLPRSNRCLYITYPPRRSPPNNCLFQPLTHPTPNSLPMPQTRSPSPESFPTPSQLLSDIAKAAPAPLPAHRPQPPAPPAQRPPQGPTGARKQRNRLASLGFQPTDP